MIDLFKAINENTYVNNFVSNSKRDPESLSYLVERILSQSDCIKLGIAIEKILKDIVLKNSLLVDIRQKNIKNIKEKDHLFVDPVNKIIYYSELKANIKLDTEKVIATQNKCLEIVRDLQQNYKDYEIKWCLLSYRYIHSSLIPQKTLKKFSKITGNISGINQYFSCLGVDLNFTEDTYKIFINEIVEIMFKVIKTDIKNEASV